MGKITESSGDITVISSDKAVIEISKPISFQIDGEYCGTETLLNVNMAARKLKIATLKV